MRIMSSNQGANYKVLTEAAVNMPAGSLLGNLSPCEAMKLQSVLLDWQLSSLLRPELKEASSLLAAETSLGLRGSVGSGSS